jgi:hypothetical protein
LPFADAKGLRDGWQDESGVANCGQRDKRDPIGECIANVNRGLKSKTGLTNTTRASQGEKRDVLVKQEGSNDSQLPLAPDERAPGGWRRSQGIGRQCSDHTSFAPTRV